MTTKERLIKYIEYKGISHSEFQRRTDLSNGYLKSGKNITSENLLTIITAFEDLNLLWLLKGTGPMILPQELRAIIDSWDNNDEMMKYLNEDPVAYMSGNLGRPVEKMSRDELIVMINLLRKSITSINKELESKELAIQSLKRSLESRDIALETLKGHIEQLNNRLSQK